MIASSGRSARTRALSYALVALGFVQSVGFLFDVSALRGLGQVTAASPLPFVFSSFRGLETFAQDFSVRLTRDDGTTATHVITPELYAKLDGPYNRRNTYGAVMSYGPALTEPKERQWVKDVIGYGLCGRGPLAQKFGEQSPIVAVAVEVKSKTKGHEKSTILEIPCSE